LFVDIRWRRRDGVERGEEGEIRPGERNIFREAIDDKLKAGPKKLATSERGRRPVRKVRRGKPKHTAIGASAGSGRGEKKKRGINMMAKMGDIHNTCCGGQGVNSAKFSKIKKK